MNETPMTHDQDTRLDSQLDALRRELGPLDTPTAVHARLNAAFGRHHRRQRFRRLLSQWLAPGIGLAASVGMAAWITLAPLSPSDMDLVPPAAADESPFIALQSLERIALEPSPRLIETDMPRTMLASLGVPINPEVAGESVHAQMLVAANGQPLAMRLTP
jgi:hypothetical protein